MNIEISKGIQLPIFDLEMLNLGKLIAIPFKQFIPDGQVLWLYPSLDIPLNLSPDEYYQPEYLGLAKNTLEKATHIPISVKTWGRCEHHWHIYSGNKYILPKIARSSIWNLNALEQIFGQYQVLKILFLRVYEFSEPCFVNKHPQNGSFFWMTLDDKTTIATDKDQAIVSESSFKQRKALMMAGDIYPNTRLESLQLHLSYSTRDDSKVKELNHQIKQLLGWSSDYQFSYKQPPWINCIAALGERSKEEEEKSNYQAGTDFEDIVRQSLEFIGFKVDYTHKGGAGGIDIFCSRPYALVGECKSGKKIPNDTAIQLLNLGTIRLENKETFSQSTKLIIGPGKATDQLKKAAKVHGMAIINPMTLEKLVKIHHQYPIDLFKLRDYLVDGQADDEVSRFIEEHIQTIQLRASIIQLVKTFLQNSLDTDADVAELYAIHVVSKPKLLLKRDEIYEILLELSSPLTGYLGRTKDDAGNYRFYYLRDLVIDDTL